MVKIFAQIFMTF